MKQTRKLILYTPHAKQLEFHNCKKRFLVASWGRQSGKSTAALNDALKYAWENPGTKTWFLAPTFDQAKGHYRRLVGMLWPCNEVLLKKNQTELRVKLINQSEINFKSGETLDNLRGATLHRAYVDEVRDQHKDLWPMVIRPMLATTKGSCRFISTPNGYDQFYDLFMYAQDNDQGDWASMQAPSTCNPLITEEELNGAKSTMSEAQFAQEYLAEFRDLTSGNAYVNHGIWNHHVGNPFWADGPIHPLLPIVVAMDFNLSPMAWTLGQKKAERLHFFDEIWLTRSHTQQASEVLVQKIREYDPKHGVVLVGDATSGAGQRAAAGQSDYDIICQALDRAGIAWRQETPEANPTIKDRVNTVNAKLKSASGETTLTYDPKKCPRLRKDFERVVWKAGNSERIVLDQVSDTELTHSSDGVGYAVCALSPIGYDAKVPSLRIIRR